MQEIRPMEGEDVQYVLKLAKEMHQEGAYSFVEFDNRTMLSTIVGCMEDPDGFAYVGTVDGRVVSGFLAAIGIYFFSKNRIATEYGVFTDKEYRKTRLAFRMLKKYIEWAKERGVTEISMGASHGFETTQVRRLGKLLERLGFNEAGVWYKLRG